MDTRYHAALPNLLVGAGLLFTFFGLAVALSSASGIVADGVDQKFRNHALQGLLDTASFKFITSLVGLFLSIVYALIRKGCLKRVERELGAFSAALESRVPLVTPAALQQETNELLLKQSIHLETFSTELAVNLGTAFDNAFDKRLGEHIAPLTDAMQRLAGGMSTRSEDVIREMMEMFLQRLQGSAGDKMHQAAESLAGLGERLQDLQATLGGAAEKIAQAAASMATGMGEGAEASLMRMSTQFESMLGELRGLAESSRAAGTSALDAVAARIAAAAAGFEAMAGQVAETLAQAAGQTGGALGRGAEEAVARIATATQDMRAEMKAAFAELSTAVGDAGNALRDGGAAGGASLGVAIGGAGDTLAAAVSAAALDLRHAGDAAATALQRGGEAASSRMDSAGIALGTQAGALGGQISGLASASSDLGVRAEELGKAAREAATPLTATAGRLESASDTLLSATQPFRSIAQDMARAAEQIGIAAQRAEAANTGALRLIENLDATTKRFESIDRALAGTLAGLQAGLNGFTDQVSRFVAGTDQNLAKAATQLGNLVKSLDDTLEDFRPNGTSTDGAPGARR
jgi:methyl-accepting chemotaxis protein